MEALVAEDRRKPGHRRSLDSRPLRLSSNVFHLTSLFFKHALRLWEHHQQQHTAHGTWPDWSDYDEQWESEKQPSPERKRLPGREFLVSLASIRWRRETHKKRQREADFELSCDGLQCRKRKLSEPYLVLSCLHLKLEEETNEAHLLLPSFLSLSFKNATPSNLTAPPASNHTKLISHRSLWMLLIEPSSQSASGTMTRPINQRRREERRGGGRQTAVEEEEGRGRDSWRLWRVRSVSAREEGLIRWRRAERRGKERRDERMAFADSRESASFLRMNRYSRSRETAQAGRIDPAAWIAYPG